MRIYPPGFRVSWREYSRLGDVGLSWLAWVWIWWLSGWFGPVEVLGWREWHCGCSGGFYRELKVNIAGEYLVKEDGISAK